MGYYKPWRIYGSITAGVIAMLVLIAISGGKNKAAEECAKLKNGMSYDTCFYQLNH